MSDEWYSLYKHAIDYAKEKDMKVWIYDENSYPSGFAGGHVPEEMPESYNQGQGLALEKVNVLPENTADYFIKNGNLEYPGGTYSSDVHNPYGSNNVAFRC